jgi:N-methylhydantoinase A
MVVLGRVTQLLDGGMPLDLAASRRALTKLGRALGTGPVAAARGVVAVANATIERALRAISVERGHDVRGAALVAFGGAGPLHACELADALGAVTVIVPPAAGILSAWGLLGADQVLAEAATLLVRVARDEPWPRARVARTLARLERALRARNGAGGRLSSIFALRYQGQSFELRLPVAGSGDPRAAFERAHLERFGYARREAAIEIVEIERSLTHKGPRLPAFPVPRRTTGVRREELGRDFHGRGPLLIPEYGATTWVPRGWHARVDARANLRLTRT